MATLPTIKSQKRISVSDDFTCKLARSLCGDSKDIKVRELFYQMEEKGILTDDPRLIPLHKDIDHLDTLTFNDLKKIIPKNLEMFQKIFTRKLVVPNFTKFKSRINKIFEETKQMSGGKVAGYIPQIAKADPDQFAVSICTIDGQQHHVGDYNQDFSVQSCCKIVNYCIALEQHGSDIVHKYVGKEPSGVEFDAITLDKRRRPHNPCTNAGAIMVCSLIGRDSFEIDFDDEEDLMRSRSVIKDDDLQSKLNDLSTSPKPSFCIRRASSPNITFSANFFSPVSQQVSFEADRFETLNLIWQRLFSGAKIGFSNSVYLSEKSTGHRNYALGHFMYEQKPGFPQSTHLKGIMEFYFQCCSLEVTTAKLSHVAATLANGGVNPLTGDQIFSTETVRNCLSIMYQCGMYDYSGEFAFTVGIPSKSSVSGAVISIIPNIMGVVTFAPPLDSYGNSVRGVEFIKKLSEDFGCHHFDNLEKAEIKAIKDKKGQNFIRNRANSKLTGINGSPDPDHSAAASTLRPVLSTGSLAEMASMDEVYREEKYDEEYMTFKALSYAGSGDLGALKRMYLKGCDLNAKDYDYRTPMHVAAASGNLEIVKFLYSLYPNNKIAEMKDRFGKTPMDDAEREERAEIFGYLRAKRKSLKRDEDDKQSVFEKKSFFDSLTVKTD